MEETMDNNEQKPKTDKVETVKKVGEAIEKTALKADEILGNSKNKMGDTGKKLTVGGTILLILAVVRDSGLLWIGAAVLAVLYLPQLVEVYKNQMKKMDEKKEEPKSTDNKEQK